MKTTSLRELCETVRLYCRRGAKTPWETQDEWQQDANSFRCTLEYAGRKYSFDFWQGKGIKTRPTAEVCLECLLSDAQAGDMDFAEFCEELGYDEDSRKAERVWRACQTTRYKLRNLLGSDYETFLYADRG